MRAAAVFALLSMLVVQTLTSMAMLSVAVVAPEAAPDIGVDATLIGAFTSIAYAVAMVMGLLTGTLIASHGAIRVCQATMACAALGLTAVAVAWPPAVVLGAVFLGAAYGPGNPASAHILTGVSPPRWRPLVFSIRQTGVPLGGAFAGAVLPFLVGEVGWRWALLLVAAIALVVLAMLQPLRRTFDAHRRSELPRGGVRLMEPLRLVLNDPALRRHAVTGFAFAGTQVCVAAFYVVYLTHALAMPLVRAGFVYAVIQVGGIIGRVLWGAMAERVFPSRIGLAVLGVLMAICLAVTAVAGGGWPPLAIAGLGFALGLTTFGWNGIFLSEIAALVPEGAVGEATGGVQFFMFGGVVAIPPCFGAAVAATGSYAVAFSGVAVLALAGGLFMLRRSAAA